MFKDESFNFFVPVDFEKANPSDPNRYKNMMLQGRASNAEVDLDEQVLEPSGFELGMFKSSGLVNYEHGAKKTPKMLIGEPVEAQVKGNEFFVKAKLWEKHPVAQDLWDTLHIMKDSGSTRKLGWSIEGVPLAKDPRNPNRITKALITNVALTFTPKNQSTFAEVCKGITVPKDHFDYDIPENTLYLFKGVLGDQEFTLNTDFTITKKAMSATHEQGQQLVGKNTSGAALKKESLDDDLKILTIPVSTINYVADNWEAFKEDTRRALKKALHTLVIK